MKFENEFTVAAELPPTWATLQDLPRVAECLPGAMLAPSSDDGIYTGRIKIKAGPIRVAYDGTVRQLDVDEDEHRSSLEATGREDAGSGAVRAVIQSRLEAVDGGTRIVMETDLQVTGRAAQFGRGVMEDISTRLLEEFARRLERMITASDQAGGAAPASAATAGSRADAVGTAGLGGADADDELDMKFAVWAVLRQRLPLLGGTAAAIGVVLWLLGRRPRRGVRISIDYRF